MEAGTKNNINGHCRLPESKNSPILVTWATSTPESKVNSEKSDENNLEERKILAFFPLKGRVKRKPCKVISQLEKEEFCINFSCYIQHR